MNDTRTQPVGTVLIVDDMDSNVQLLARLLTRDGHRVEVARNGQEAVERIHLIRPDVVLMDVRMPVLDGFEACGRIKADPITRLTPVVLLTALQDSEDRLRGIEMGADDFISKPFSAPELRARVRSLLRIKRYTDDLDSAESVIMSLALTVEARDPLTEGHCQRLSLYATALAAELGLDADETDALRRGGFLHDIGKIGIPDGILLKPDRLTAEEYSTMKEHTLIGERLCGELRALRHVRPIVRHHHERLDGSGYPDGLAGDQIPLLAQIIGVVDVFDALTTARPYRAPLSVEQGYRELLAEVEHGWRRADLAEAFIALHRSGNPVAHLQLEQPRQILED